VGEQCNVTLQQVCFVIFRLRRMNFDYIVTNVVDKSYKDDENNLIEEILPCTCLSECSSSNNCSCLPFGDMYDDGNRLKIFSDENISIVECGSRCACADPLKNIKVQILDFVLLFSSI